MNANERLTRVLNLWKSQLRTALDAVRTCCCGEATKFQCDLFWRETMRHQECCSVDMPNIRRTFTVVRR
jgi:hypothetical protein